jgi:predicted ferric reductase
MSGFTITRFRQLIPVGEFFLFVAFHYLLALGQVPAKNQIPATLGASALTAMTVSMVLAARLPRIDRLMNGPGRAYRLHRWLGYSCLLVIIGHWLTASSAGSGIIPEMGEFAGRSGRYATLLLIVLVLVSALKFVPYHLWRTSHFLMGPIYLVAVYHTFFSQIPVAIFSRLWWILLVISLVGILAFALILLRHIRYKPAFVVTEVQPIKNGLDFQIRPVSARDHVTWIPGQYASLSVDVPGLREPHPFTITGSPGNGQMRFIVGMLGDYTSALGQKLKVGDVVRIHSISGEFQPQYAPDRPDRQVWVAAGVGITPFIAAIDAMKPDDGPPIDLIYCYRSLAWAIHVEWLVERAEALPQLRVHFVGKDEAGPFNAAMLPQLLSAGWKDGRLAVCGPDRFIDLVCDSWRLYGGRAGLQVELFEFRKGLDLRTLFQNRVKPKRPLTPAQTRNAIKSFG